MQIQLNTYTMHLEDQPLDIGYASEKVDVKSPNGTNSIIGGQNGKTQLIISVPFIDDAFVKELEALQEALPTDDESSVTASIIVANDDHTDPGIKPFKLYIDYDEAFGDWYGVRLADGPCQGELTKALFVISKDGALFYDEIVSNLHTPFNADKALLKVAAAINTYTGKGCH